MNEKVITQVKANLESVINRIGSIGHRQLELLEKDSPEFSLEALRFATQASRPLEEALELLSQPEPVEGKLLSGHMEMPSETRQVSPVTPLETYLPIFAAKLYDAYPNGLVPDKDLLDTVASEVTMLPGDLARNPMTGEPVYRMVVRLVGAVLSRRNYMVKVGDAWVLTELGHSVIADMLQGKETPLNVGPKKKGRPRSQEATEHAPSELMEETPVPEMLPFVMAELHSAYPNGVTFDVERIDRIAERMKLLPGDQIVGGPTKEPKYRTKVRLALSLIKRRHQAAKAGDAWCLNSDGYEAAQQMAAEGRLPSQ